MGRGGKGEKGCPPALRLSQGASPIHRCSIPPSPPPLPHSLPPSLPLSPSPSFSSLARSLPPYSLFPLPALPAPAPHPSPHPPPQNGATPLFIASQKGHLPVVEQLIAARADVQAKKTVRLDAGVAGGGGRVRERHRLCWAGAGPHAESRALPPYLLTRRTPLILSLQICHAIPYRPARSAPHPACLCLAPPPSLPFSTPSLPSPYLPSLPPPPVLASSHHPTSPPRPPHLASLVHSLPTHWVSLVHLSWHFPSCCCRAPFPGQNGWNALQIASYQGHLPVVERLIAARANVDARLPVRSPLRPVGE